MSLAPSFAQLSPAALEEMSNARSFVARTVSDLLDESAWPAAEGAIPVLQRLVAHEAMQHANDEAWVAVGIAFGDALIERISGLAWRQVTDQHGTHVALQFARKALSIAAPTMLWKRIQRGEQLDLSHIAAELESFIAANAQESHDA